MKDVADMYPNCQEILRTIKSTIQSKLLMVFETLQIRFGVGLVLFAFLEPSLLIFPGFCFVFFVFLDIFGQTRIEKSHENYYYSVTLLCS